MWLFRKVCLSLMVGLKLFERNWWDWRYKKLMGQDMKYYLRPVLLCGSNSGPPILHFAPLILQILYVKSTRDDSAELQQIRPLNINVTP